MKYGKMISTATLGAMLVLNPLWHPGSTAHAQDTAGKQVVLTLGSQEALIGDQLYQLEIPPEVVNGTTFLPVRFVAEEILDATVNWDPVNRTIGITKDGSNISLTLDELRASVDGADVEISSPPFIKEGRTLVPLRFLAENLAMKIDFNSLERTITITEIITGEEPAPVDQPPVITSLGLQRDVIKIGEEAEFSYTYSNEEGESITEEEWSYQPVGEAGKITGKARAFFRPGEYMLSLRIKDSAGHWSEPASTTFTVSEDKLMGEMTFKFSKPLYGEMFENVDNVNFNYYESNEDISIKTGGPVLHLSNSPEVVNTPGILYRSEASGDFRLLYHHLNGASERQYLYIIAENNGPGPVTLSNLKSGVGGPVDDYMNLGQVVVMRYLSSQPAAPVVINPGEKVILNPGLRHLNNREAVTGMQDFRADGAITITVAMGPENPPVPEPVDEPGETEGAVPPENPGETISVITGDTTSGNDAAPEGEGNGVDSEAEPGGETDIQPEQVPVKTAEELLREKIDYLLSLPALPTTTQQVRGLFPGGDRLVEIEVNEDRQEKIILGKEVPDFEAWGEGVDPLTGDMVKNVGNYGVVYRLKMSAPVKTGVLLNPRGSIFKGAFTAPDGTVYKAPTTSHFTGLQRAAVLGVLEPGKTYEFIYSPPSGSDTPVILALIPETFWD